jgi:hypothetical protein
MTVDSIDVTSITSEFLDQPDGVVICIYRFKPSLKLSIHAAPHFLVWCRMIWTVFIGRM